MPVHKKKKRSDFQDQSFGPLGANHHMERGGHLAQNTPKTQENSPSLTDAPPKQEERQEQNEAEPSPQEVNPTEQVQEDMPAAIDVNEESFNGIKTLYEEKLHALMDRVEGPISNRENLQVLFDILKRDGELGIRYEESTERESKTPQQVLDTKIADCNELSLLFAVCAKKLEMDVTDVKMLLMEVHFQTGQSPGHAAIVTSKEGSYLIDPAFLDQVNVFHPQDPENVKSAEIRDFYTKTPDQRMIVGITITEKAINLNEMYAVNLMETVGVYEDMLRSVQGSEAGELRVKTIGVLENAYDANNKDVFAQRKLMFHYTVLADEAFENAENTGNKVQKQRYLAISKHYCEKAIDLYQKCEHQYTGKEETEDVADIRKNTYHVHDLMSKMHVEENNHEAYAAELNKMINLMPEETTAYLSKIELYEYSARKARAEGNSESERKHLQKAKATLENAKRQFEKDPFKMSEFRRVSERIDERLKEIQ